MAKPVLLFFSSQSETVKLQIEREIVAVSEVTRNAFELRLVPTGGVDDLKTELNNLGKENRLVLLHISAHGNEDRLEVQVPTWKANATTGGAYSVAEFKVLLQSHPCIKAVFVSACDSAAFLENWSNGAGEELAFHLGFKGKVYDEDARAIARSFYSCLLNGNKKKEKLEAWQAINTLCELKVYPIIDSLRLPDLDPTSYAQVKAYDEDPDAPQSTGKEVSFLHFGEFWFQSETVLVYGKTNATKVHVPASKSINPLEVTDRTVKSLSGLPFAEGSTTTVIQLGRGCVAALAVLVVGLLALLWVLKLSGGIRPPNRILTVPLSRTRVAPRGRVEALARGGHNGRAEDRWTKALE